MIVRGEGFKEPAIDQLQNTQMSDPRFLYMDGAEIFNFTLRTVPGLVTDTLRAAGKPPELYSAYLFHQANLFMLKHLIKKMKLSPERVPLNINRYGNTSSASIPLLMTTELKEGLRESALLLAMFGFGVGFSWSSASLTVGPLKAVELIEL